MYGDITINNVNFSWASTRILIEVIGTWDLLTFEEKIKLQNLLRERNKTEREKAKEKASKNEENKNSLF